MDQVIIEGVRCFHSRQSGPLRPITLLVGENSSGKTTFLAMARIAWDMCQLAPLIDFNEEPFLLGTYDQIATYRGGRTGRAKCFTIGAEVPVSSQLKKNSPHTIANVFTVVGSFTPKEAQPMLRKWVLSVDPFRLEVGFGGDGGKPHIVVTAPSGKVTWTPNFIMREMFQSLNLFLSVGREIAKDQIQIEGEQPSQSDMQVFDYLIQHYFQSLEARPFAFAPIRTHPQRTYDPLKSTPRPEGSHVPMILAKTSSSDPKGWSQLRQSLDEFGKTSGLFSDVEIRRMGQKESDPFQVQVKISGPPFNLVDVGYGVSQVLPIVVDALRGQPGSTFLLQQPEVHLHPKAQAELGSFLALLAKQQHKRFLIETHSDYLVDRIRMDVRDKEYLSPNDVSILYFERENGGVKIQPLELDQFGNIVKSPRGYRQFFLEEEMRLLGG